MLQHVLVIDDQSSVCDFVQTALTGVAARRVSVASSDSAALSVMRVDPPDLVLLDAANTDAGGLDLAYETAARQIPFLAMTDAPPVMAWLEKAGWPHLCKPFTVDELLRGIRQAVLELRETRRLVAETVRQSQDLREESFRERRRSANLRHLTRQLVGASSRWTESVRSPQEIAIVRAAEAWACAMEAVKHADEERRFDGLEDKALEDAEGALYDAVLTWRVTRPSRLLR